MRLFSVRSWCAQWCGSHSPETDSKTENLCGKCTGGHSGTHTCRRSRTGHGRGWAGMQPQSCRRSLEVLWSWEGPAELSWVGVRGLGLQKHEPPSVTGRWMSRGGDVPLSEEAKGDFRRGLRAEACWGDGGWAAQHSSYHMWLLANLPLNIWTNQYKWKIQSQEKKKAKLISTATFPPWCGKPNWKDARTRMRFLSHVSNENFELDQELWIGGPQAEFVYKVFYLHE